ncbi:hypothetical protein OUZ56_011950 [Daphnia magna]|uniref:Uncharacterized protein n=1 Tax=Daphnia magna TaxID=35525 RepID=A0ABQ9Z1L4_9CRUS|nr:hypothetical protein OUZ56_011950 [Daphnia magna]
MTAPCLCPRGWDKMPFTSDTAVRACQQPIRPFLSTIRRLDLPGQFQKGYPPTMDYKDPPHLADLKAPGRPPQRPLITTKDDILTQQTGLRTGSTNNHLRDLTTGMVHQMDGLSDLEHAKLNKDITQTYPRYPWEWIDILILCMLGTGVAIAADRTKTASRQQKIEAQIQALEQRLQLHEQATSPDETE